MKKKVKIISIPASFGRWYYAAVRFEDVNFLDMSRESLYTWERRNGFLCSATTAPLALIFHVYNIRVNNLNFLFIIVAAIAIPLDLPLGAFTNDDCT